MMLTKTYSLRTLSGAAQLPFNRNHPQRRGDIVGVNEGKRGDIYGLFFDPGPFLRGRLCASLPFKPIHCWQAACHEFA